MTTNEALARAFVRGATKGRVGNAAIATGPTGDVHYKLHGNTIATRSSMSGRITGDWCGWYTPTTANHLGHIVRAAGVSLCVSYAQARKSGVERFTII